MSSNEINQFHYGESPKTREQLDLYINTYFDSINFPETTKAVLDFYSSDDEIQPGAQGHLEQAVAQFNSIKKTDRTDEEIKELILEGLKRRTQTTNETSYRVGTKEDKIKELLLKGEEKRTQTTNENSYKTGTKEDAITEKSLTYEEKIKDSLYKTDVAVTNFLDNYELANLKEKEVLKKDANSKIAEISSAFGENEDVQEAIIIWRNAISKIENQIREETEKEEKINEEINKINSEVLKFATNFSNLPLEEQKNARFEIIKRIKDFYESNKDREGVKEVVKPWVEVVRDIEPINEKL